MNKDMHVQDNELFYKKCAEHGLKVTPQRTLIYDVLMKRTDHPSADTVYKAVRKKLPNISFDTVYRTLISFTEIGLLQVSEVFGGIKRFETVLTPHHHMHCTRCQKIIDFTDPSFDKLAVPERLRKDFTVLSKRVVLEGLCSACAGK